MKKFWKSKTLWVNLVAVLALALQSATGYAVDPAVQAALLAVINAVLRLITKEKLEW